MRISVVTTLFYSEEYIEEFYLRTLTSIKKITPDYEFIFVNDGSPDNSLFKTLEIQKYDPNIFVIDLSRNFGHHKAIMAGLMHTKGDYVFLIDVDLEEDPELLSTYWNQYNSNNSDQLDVVFGIQEKRKGNYFERISGKLFYKGFSLLADIEYPHNTLTARLMTKNYVDAVISHSEKSLEIWGIFVLTGFNQKGIIVKKGFKGTSTYTFRKKVKMATETITSFSSRPLYLIFLLGLIMISTSLIYILIVIYQKMFLNIDSNGWSSIIVSIWLVGGLVMFMLGIIGIYLSKIFTEIKNRPLFIVKNIYKNDN